ncbi:hypothetical protein KAF44_20660 (plasmid) [Cupriavidus necator]|nr:hypothetical protein KAF44_20660 [Cupriavidus necator]
MAQTGNPATLFSLLPNQLPTPPFPGECVTVTQCLGVATDRIQIDVLQFHASLIDLMNINYRPDSSGLFRTLHHDRSRTKKKTDAPDESTAAGANARRPSHPE